MASLRPSAAMREAAAKGLKLREQFGRGGLSTRQAAEQGVGSGVQRAVNIARGDELPLETWKRVKSYFDRHQGDKDAKGSPSRGYWGDDSNPSAGYVAWLLWGSDAGWEQARQVLKAKNPGGRVMGLFDRLRRKPKQTFEEACYQRKPPGLRPRQTVVVDNEGRYFLVSENTPEHQRMAGYREVLVFPSDSAGNVCNFSEVGGRRHVGFVTFLTDLLEGRETLHEPWLKEEGGMRRNPKGGYRYMVVEETIGDEGDAEYDVIVKQTASGLPEAVRDVEDYGWTEWDSMPPQRGRLRSEAQPDMRTGDYTSYSLSIERADGKPLSQEELAYIDRTLKIGAMKGSARRNPAYSIFDDLPDYEVELPQRRSRSRSPANYGAFQLRSEDGRTASFPTKREAEEWADTFLASGTYFTIVNTKTDALTEYEKD